MWDLNKHWFWSRWGQAISAMRMLNFLRKQKGSALCLASDLYWGLTVGCLGEAAGEHDSVWLPILPYGKWRCMDWRTVRYVFSHRDEWRGRCGQCQSDSLASVSPGDPEEPSGWTHWTACCRDRRRTMKTKGQTDLASWAGWLLPILSNDPKQN